MSEAKHTQGKAIPAVSSFPPIGPCYSVGMQDTKVAIAVTGKFDESDADISEANARRLAACWNFCEGIPTSEMEGNTFEDYVAEQAFINGMAPSEEGMTIGVNGLAAQLMAASFAGQFVGSGAINYLAINMEHREIGEFVVTMQRKNGITPAEKLKQVKAQRDELLALLKEVAGNFTQDDDLPDNLLPRIDAAIDKVEGGAA